jgi:hypothetical protein
MFVESASMEVSAFVGIECQIALLAGQQTVFSILVNWVGGHWVRMMLKWVKFT